MYNTVRFFPMWIASVKLENIKSFHDSGDIIFSKGINLRVGANNSGKSVIIKSIYQLQNRNLHFDDLRIGQNEGEIIITFDGLNEDYLLPHERNIFTPQGNHEPKVHIHTQKKNGRWFYQIIDTSGQARSDFNEMVSEEPRNFIYPYLSKRKVTEFTQTVNKPLTRQVPENLSNLVSKVDRISNPKYPLYQQYKDACLEILGFEVSAFSSDNGKQAGIIVNSFDNIPLEAMGEGVSSLLGLITNLCIADNRLFLIEEIENDIHPKSLKALLKLILQKSQKNQFIISTHSNIVTKYLGSSPDSKIHSIDMEFQEGIPTSVYTAIGNTPEERRKILEDLGYEVFDFDLWKGWLFLEESSAERIIKEYFIKWFAQGLLNKLRTFSCDGVDKVDPKFEDFNRLFLFTHLGSIYKNYAWVMVDGDKRGKEVISHLKQIYTPSGWEENQFLYLHKEDFEKYYPKRFSKRVKEAIQISDKQKKRAGKELLLKDVLEWIVSNEKSAKSQFEESAKEIIAVLRIIEKKLN